MQVQQYLDEKDTGDRVSHIVVMGIGGPFDNYDNVMSFLRIVNNEKGLSIGARHITVSTSGLAPKIKEIVPFKLLEVTPQKYNAIQPKYNAVHMKVALHNQAIQLLLEQIQPEQPEGILIDQFTPENNYRKYLKGEKNPITENLYFITKGEQYHLAVAAASILCRAKFLESLRVGSSELGIVLPSGAGTRSDQVAATILKRGGLPLLEQYAKLHFANTQKALKLARMSE